MSLYGVIDYHVTLSEGHMIANHPIYGSDWLSYDSLRWSHDGQSPHIRKHLVATLIYLSQNYSYYLRGDRSPLRAYIISCLATNIES